MKKFNFKNGKEKLVEKANNVKEKCVGYVDDHPAITVGVIIYYTAFISSYIGCIAQQVIDHRTLVDNYYRGFDDGFNNGMKIYNKMLKELTEMSKESN